MISSQKEFLSQFGWDDFFESQILTLPSENQFIARVINEEKNLYRLQIGKEKTIWSAVPGKMLFEATSREDFPAVGDWVLAELPPGSERAVIRNIMKRKSVLQRKKVGEVSEVQILATNVDYVLITTSINGDLNFGRLERYLTFAWDSGATAVILLTKADLSEDIERVIHDVEERFPGVNIHSVSKDDYENAKCFEAYLVPGKTAVLVGSSGVGKSTLSNYLIGKEVIATQEVREGDDKGKHTTTSRSMYKTFYGGLIIDTPGMRELQFSDHEEGLERSFGDILDLIHNCHYSDCQHQTEKNCAVQAAFESGELTMERWKSYIKIQGEVRHEMRKQSKQAMAEDRKAWKKLSIESRKNNKGWH